MCARDEVRQLRDGKHKDEIEKRLNSRDTHLLPGLCCLYLHPVSLSSKPYSIEWSVVCTSYISTANTLRLDIRGLVGTCRLSLFVLPLSPCTFFRLRYGSGWEDCRVNQPDIESENNYATGNGGPG